MTSSPWHSSFVSEHTLFFFLLLCCFFLWCTILRFVYLFQALEAKFKDWSGEWSTFAWLTISSSKAWTLSAFAFELLPLGSVIIFTLGRSGLYFSKKPYYIPEKEEFLSYLNLTLFIFFQWLIVNLRQFSNLWRFLNLDWQYGILSCFITSAGLEWSRANRTVF